MPENVSVHIDGFGAESERDLQPLGRRPLGVSKHNACGRCLSPKRGRVEGGVDDAAKLDVIVRVVGVDEETTSLAHKVVGQASRRETTDADDGWWKANAHG